MLVEEVILASIVHQSDRVVQPAMGSGKVKAGTKGCEVVVN
jgi:hypothetical protein